MFSNFIPTGHGHACESYLVMNATDGPNAADVAIGITTIDLPLVIQPQCKVQGLLRAGRPLQNLKVHPTLSALQTLAARSG